MSLQHCVVESAIFIQFVKRLNGMFLLVHINVAGDQVLVADAQVDVAETIT